MGVRRQSTPDDHAAISGIEIDRSFTVERRAFAAFAFTVVLAATLVPAWRAVRVDPVEALRDE